MATVADAEALEERRKSLVEAKRNLELAQEEAAKFANIFAREGYDKIKAAAQQAQLVSSRRWYNFWEKASRVPSTLTLSDGSKLDWTEVLNDALAEVRAAVEAPESDFEKPSSKSGATVAWSKTRVERGIPLVRIEKEVSADPRAILLSQIRAAHAGNADPSVLYMREHYTYRGGQSSIMHVVKRFGSTVVSNRDFTVFQTWAEADDGTITFAVKSVDETLAKKIVPGAVRGQRLLFGMQIRPAKVTKTSFFGATSETDGAKVVAVSHALLGGYLPVFLQKQYVVSEILSILSTLDGAKPLPDTTELIERFIENPDSDDEEGDAAAAAAVQAEAEVEAEVEAAEKLGINVEEEIGDLASLRSAHRDNAEPEAELEIDEESDAGTRD
ncbi:START domain containing protein [Hondaea fermentalgiana]|uniref:START domain containing protein n=1 Tax=Hondaea fermentalgiana TaxID=2315210 RepID=A0A2R5GQM4_9STRA|nr:START domain containing protein [Hondaea fermentalgiana]|eukprot:GBG33150.1 START domain containing protein [Hondaea fermentalgiana]